jgi:hypothetical protein
METQPQHQHVHAGLQPRRIGGSIEAAVEGAVDHGAIDKMAFHLKIQVGAEVDTRGHSLVEDVVLRVAMVKRPIGNVARLPTFLSKNCAPTRKLSPIRVEALKPKW